MERRRRLTSLRSVLLRYLCLCGGGCALILVLWWGIFMQLIDNGFLLSATASAQACAEARETVASMTADTFDPSAISSLCRYAVVCDANTDAERVTTTNMSAHQLKTALNDLHGGSGNLGMMQYQYIVTMADGATCLLQYDYAVPYADPALRERLPDFQTCYIILLVVLMLAWLAVTTHRTVRTFTAETSRIDEATRQIAAQHPEAVDVDHARIREFSATLQALQTMGQQLTDSLQRQWQLEQQRTEQVAALAHDLKTPLTIIQGNAELLAESASRTGRHPAGRGPRPAVPCRPAQCGHCARRPPVYRQPCLCCRAGGYGQRPLPPGPADLCAAGKLAGAVPVRRAGVDPRVGEYPG